MLDLSLLKINSSKEIYKQLEYLNRNANIRCSVIRYSDMEYSVMNTDLRH